MFFNKVLPKSVDSCCHIYRERSQLIFSVEVLDQPKNKEALLMKLKSEEDVIKDSGLL